MACNGPPQANGESGAFETTANLMSPFWREGSPLEKNGASCGMSADRAGSTLPSPSRPFDLTPGRRGWTTSGVPHAG